MADEWALPRSCSNGDPLDEPPLEQPPEPWERPQHPDTTSEPVTPEPREHPRTMLPRTTASLVDVMEWLAGPTSWRDTVTIESPLLCDVDRPRVLSFSSLDVALDDALLDERTREVARGEADEVLASLEAEMERIVRAAIEQALDAALPAVVLTAAGPEEILSLDGLAAIPTQWERVLPDVVAQVVHTYSVGALGVWMAHADAHDAVARARGLDALGDVLDEHAADYLAGAANRLRGIGQATWTTMRTQLEAGFRAGEGIDKLADRIEDGRRISASRAQAIARTEVVSAANAGQIEAARSMSFDVGDEQAGPRFKQWLATLDARTRDSHAEADGQVQRLDDPFDVGGESLDYPGDPAGSAAETVNCRCTMLFIDDETDPTIEDPARQTGGDVTDPDGGDAESLIASQEAHAMTLSRRRPLAMTVEDGRLVVPIGDHDSAALTRAVAAAIARMSETEAETEVDETLPENRPDTPSKSDEAVDTDRPETWHGVLVVEGVPSGDRRLIEEGALTWRDLPLPLMWQTEQPETGGHARSVHVAQITRMERQGTEIHAWGYHLTERPDGSSEPTDGEIWYASLLEAERHGVSVDMDDADVEIDWPEPEEGDDEEDMPLMLFEEPDLIRFTRARLMGATDVPFPAFSEAFVEPIESEQPDDDEEQPTDEPVDDEEPADDDAALVAASIPERPPAAWFEQPVLDGPTPLTIDDDGRVYGHLAAWGTCHTSFAGTCVTPPHEDEMAYFTTGEVVCDDGSRVAVGQITMGTGHAPHEMNPTEAASHYDHTGTPIMDVAVGPDEHGIWCAGALRPGTTGEQVRVARAAAPSGDWRRIGGRLRLMGALLVNVPGFPIPRTASRTRGDVQTTLVAAGIVRPRAHVARRSTQRSALAGVAERIARSVGRDHASRAAQMHERVHQGIGAFGCGCGGQSKPAPVLARADRSKQTVTASAGRTRYEVVYADGNRQQVASLIEARRLSRATPGARMKVL